MKTRVRVRGCGRSGFTVVELFAVLAVVSLLGFLFLPVVLNARADAQTALCAENLRQLGRAATLYSAENGGRFPGTQHERPSWVEGLEEYGVAGKFTCEIAAQSAEYTKGGSRPQWTYALNDFLTPHPYGARQANFSRMPSVPSPTETLMYGEAAEGFRFYDHFHFADAVENGFSPAAFGEQVDAELHDAGANYLFIDGRVEWLGWSSDARPKLKFPGSKFVHPAGETAAQQLVAK